MVDGNAVKKIYMNNVEMNKNKTHDHITAPQTWQTSGESGSALKGGS